MNEEKKNSKEKNRIYTSCYDLILTECTDKEIVLNLSRYQLGILIKSLERDGRIANRDYHESTELMSSICEILIGYKPDSTADHKEKEEIIEENKSTPWWKKYTGRGPVR